MKNEFVPCKECIDCALYSLEDEPLYYCKMIGEKRLFSSMNEMINFCPIY